MVTCQVLGLSRGRATAAVFSVRQPQWAYEQEGTGWREVSNSKEDELMQLLQKHGFVGMLGLSRVISGEPPETDSGSL